MDNIKVLETLNKLKNGEFSVNTDTTELIQLISGLSLRIAEIYNVLENYTNNGVTNVNQLMDVLNTDPIKPGLMELAKKANINIPKGIVGTNTELEDYILNSIKETASKIYFKYDYPVDDVARKNYNGAVTSNNAANSVSNFNANIVTINDIGFKPDYLMIKVSARYGNYIPATVIYKNPDCPLVGSPITTSGATPYSHCTMENCGSAYYGVNISEGSTFYIREDEIKLPIFFYQGSAPDMKTQKILDIVAIKFSL